MKPSVQNLKVGSFVVEGYFPFGLEIRRTTFKELDLDLD